MDDGTILTTVALSVDRVLTGDLGGTVEVETLGGELDGKVQHVGGEPAMPLGSRYLLLMNKPQGSRLPFLIGGTFGARRLEPETERAEVDRVQAWKKACSEETPATPGR
jgi:hypothetical protein